MATPVCFLFLRLGGPLLPAWQLRRLDGLKVWPISLASVQNVTDTTEPSDPALHGRTWLFVCTLYSTPPAALGVETVNGRREGWREEGKEREGGDTCVCAQLPKFFAPTSASPFFEPKLSD